MKILSLLIALLVLSVPLYSKDLAETISSDLAQTILALPGWEDVEEGGGDPMPVADLRMYFDVAERVRTLDKRTIDLLLRKLLVATVNDFEGLCETRPYILFRVLFDVTDNVRLRPAVHWADNNPGESILYPLTMTAEGKLRVGFHCLGRDGSAYDPEADYKILRSIFKYRDLGKTRP